jgi:hypothetical protein
VVVNLNGDRMMIFEHLKLNLTENIYNKTLSYTCFPVSCPKTSPVTWKLAIIGN